MKFLLAIDTDETQSSLMDVALAWAAQAGATLDVLSVMSLGWVDASQGDPVLREKVDRLVDEFRRSHVDAVRRRGAAVSGVTLGEAVLSSGIPDVEIQRAIESGDYQAVLLGPGRGGLNRVLLGSVSARTLRASPIPVLVLRTPPANARRMLVAVDLREDSDALLSEAATWAQAMGVKLDLLCVDELPDGSEQIHDPTVRAFVQQEQERQREHRWNALEERLSSLPEAVRGLAQTAEGSAADAIVKHAGSYAAVVIATHGRQGIPRLFLGSVAENVANRAPTSVLVLRLAEGESAHRDV